MKCLKSVCLPEILVFKRKKGVAEMNKWLKLEFLTFSEIGNFMVLGRYFSKSPFPGYFIFFDTFSDYQYIYIAVLFLSTHLVPVAC